MIRYLLDTNIISWLQKPDPPPNLLEWLVDQFDDTLFISSLTLAEIKRGVLQKPAGRRRKDLENWYSGPLGPLAQFRGRILPFDEAAAPVWARLMADGSGQGRPRSALDMVIAAVAVSNACMIVTDNTKDFWGLDYLNPCS